MIGCSFSGVLVTLFLVGLVGGVLARLSLGAVGFEFVDIVRKIRNMLV